MNPTQRELADLYGEADLFVSAERRAGWCNTAAEAMACGARWLHAEREPKIRDQRRHRGRGSLGAVVLGPVPGSRALLRDAERRRALGGAGTLKIQEFSWERTADRIERALTARMGGRARGERSAQAIR